MTERRPLEDLTLMDDYMFWAVMKRKELLIHLLEYILDITIIDLNYSKGQETIKDGYDSRGVRLDVFVKDEKGRWYNIDFVIFITRFDTHRRDKKLYWFESRDRFEADLLFGNEVNYVIVNVTGTKGTISKELEGIIQYLKTGETGDEYTKELDEEVNTVKRSDERKAEYMKYITYEDELRRDERLRTKAEDVMNLVNKLGYPLDEALAFYEVKESDKPQIKELVAQMMNLIPA